MSSRGRLRVYLGAAPGVGKTYAMLGEGHRRADRGTDVVVGFVETHGRAHTAAMLDGLETVPRRHLTHRGAAFTEMDVDAVLARRPRVALVDELAHTNVPGSRNAKRWADIEELLSAGIDVISTVNIQHLESVNDVVEKITGVPQRETVPDAFVRAADQVEVVDMTAEALRRRLAHGNVYAPEKVDAALANYFRAGNLTALRELALLWVADKVDEALQDYRVRHDITGTWEARERVVVALSGGAEGETLIRRAARIAARATGGELLALHVARSDGLAGADAAALAEQRRLVESLDGTFHQVLGVDIPSALLAFARAENATQLVLGDSRRTRWSAVVTGPGIGTRTIRRSGDIDVHIVTHRHAGRGTAARSPRGSITRRRRLQGLAVALLLPAVLTLGLIPLRDRLNLVSDVLLFLLAVVIAAVMGGVGPALAAAVVGSLLLNYFFTPPLHTLTIGDANNALALVLFLVVAVLVSSVVDLASRRTRQAGRAAAEARVLATLAGTVVDAGGLPSMLERARETFGLDGVTLLEQDAETWTPVAVAGTPSATPTDADTTVSAGRGLVLAVRGGPVRSSDQRILGAFGVQAGLAWERRRLREAAADAAPLAEADRVRTALLAAVGHDLRTPLAVVKAAITGLLATDITIDEHDQRDLLQTADESVDKLTALVENLLDLSRLQAGVLPVHLHPVLVDEVITRAVDDLGATGRSVRATVADDLPPAYADPGLLERVLVNLLANAVRHSPHDRPPVITVSALGAHVEIRVSDRGPGIPASSRAQVFLPFQRLGDTDNTTGVGLGLALSRGLTEAMGGTLEPDETPGGGLTMVVALRAADRGPAEPGLRERHELPR